MSPISITISILLFFLSHLSTSETNGPDLIHQTCNKTTYPTLCISTLQSTPSSSASSDAKGLSTILLNFSAANAISTASYATKLAKTTTNNALKTALLACAGRYADASDSLRSAVDALEGEMFDYALVHVNAVMEYPVLCRDRFERAYGLKYPAEMCRREVALEQLCSVAKDIIGGLG